MVKTVLQWCGLFFGALILQGSLVQVASIAGIRPDLPKIVLFFFALEFGILPAVCVGFVLGLSQDLFSVSILGQNALCTMVFGGFSGLFNERVIRTDPLMRAVILCLAFGIHDTLYIIVQGLKVAGLGVNLFFSLIVTTLPRALYSIVIAAGTYLWTYYIRPSSRP